MYFPKFNKKLVELVELKNQGEKIEKNHFFPKSFFLKFL